jgi:hypothetical protein
METNGHEGLIKQGRVYTKNFRRVVVLLANGTFKRVVLKSSAIFFSRSVCTDLLNPDPEQLLYYFCRWSIGISVCFSSFAQWLTYSPIYGNKWACRPYYTRQGLYKEFQEGRSIVGKRYLPVLRSMALVPNQASANKKSTLTPSRMARAIILLARHCANEEKQTEIPIDHLQK